MDYLQCICECWVASPVQHPLLDFGMTCSNNKCSDYALGVFECSDLLYVNANMYKCTQRLFIVLYVIASIDNKSDALTTATLSQLP